MKTKRKIETHQLN